MQVLLLLWQMDGTLFYFFIQRIDEIQFPSPSIDLPCAQTKSCHWNRLHVHKNHVHKNHVQINQYFCQLIKIHAINKYAEGLNEVLCRLTLNAFFNNNSTCFLRLINNLLLLQNEESIILLISLLIIITIIYKLEIKVYYNKIET